MIYYISDTHFGGEYILKSDKRQFETVEEMDKFMIEAWNSVVTKRDTVFIVGDFCTEQALKEKGLNYYVKKLYGQKHLIIGNHDKLLVSDRKTLNYFESVSVMKTISDGDKQIVLCHYPIIEWDGYSKGYYHVFGHLHKTETKHLFTMAQEEKALNACCMLNNYIPMTFKQLVEHNEELRKNLLIK